MSTASREHRVQGGRPRAPRGPCGVCDTPAVIPEEPSDRLRLAVDATALLGHQTGIGVYVRNLLDRLGGRRDLDVRAFAVSLRGRTELPTRVPAGVTVVRRGVPARLVRQLWLRADHPDVRVLAGAVDVVHGPNYVVPPGGPAAEVVTISDLSAIHFPQMCSPDVLQWPPLLRRALRRGAWVHTISHAVADEVRALHPEAADRIVAVPLAVDRPPPPLPATSSSRGRHLAGGDRYVLSLGTAEPRKDLPGLVGAFDAIADDDAEVRLVLAGPDGTGAGELDAAIGRSRYRDRIVRVGWVDDEGRLALLRGATVVAYPSRYEGFGLVPLEAIAAGTPVVATATGAIPEVLGDGGLLVPPGDVGALADGLQRVLSDEQLVTTLLRNGSARVDAYSWSGTVEGIVGVYRSALADKRSRR